MYILFYFYLVLDKAETPNSRGKSKTEIVCYFGHCYSSQQSSAQYHQGHQKAPW